jgi:hypothetical protein
VAFEFNIPDSTTAVGLVDSMTLAPLETRDVPIRLRGRLPADSHPLTVLAREERTGVSDGPRILYTDGVFTVDYPHIRPVVLSRPSGVWVKAVSVAVPSGLRIGYVPGVSDDVGAVLAQLDLPVETIDPERFGATDLRAFNVIVIGPRAYQRTPGLAVFTDQLLQFARAGGTVFVQYGQQEMLDPGMLPYPIAFDQRPQRVTLEDADVRIVDAASSALTVPNRITAADFDNWVQERALYLPSRADSAWHTVLEMNDPGEPPNRHALLIARPGSGAYVYTTLSFFRQLPAGNDGAIRLFVNLLAGARRPSEAAASRHCRWRLRWTVCRARPGPGDGRRDGH